MKRIVLIGTLLLYTSLGNRTPYEVYFKKPIPPNPGQASQTMPQMQPTFSS
jgi:hypothetical protein